MEEIVDQEVAITHEKLSEEMEACIESTDKLQKVKIKSVPPEDLEICYSPVIQSGGTYSLKASAQSDTNKLKYDVIIASMGVRYKNYCSNVGRTYFVDPVKPVEEAYIHLEQLQSKVAE